MDITLWVACAAILAAGLVLIVILWKRGKGWLRGVLVGVATIALVAGVVALQWDWDETVWVYEVEDGADGTSNSVTFVAPRADGSAQGRSFVFNSRAEPDEVFGAFLKAYPAANREGDVATLELNGHAYVLERTSGDSFEYELRQQED